MVLAVKEVLNLKGTQIQYDSNEKRMMFVTYQGAVYEFNKHRDGLYFCEHDKIIKGYNNVQTVYENETKYTKNDRRRAKQVTELQERLNWPGTISLINMLNDK